MGLSSNILWHQTDAKGFEGILASKQLLYSYSLETIKAGDETLVEAFPMISLSDLPFAELDFYLNCEKYDSRDAKFKTYGGYVFGFRRQWGIRHKFSPVWYCETYHEGLRRIVVEWKRRRGDVLLYHLIGNIKNNEGELPGFNLDVYRFYNEREYRRLLDGANNQTLTQEEYERYKKDHGKSSLCDPRWGVDFDVADVLYIIVPDDGARRDFYLAHAEEWNGISVFTRDEVNQNFIGIRHHHIKPAAGENKENKDTENGTPGNVPNDMSAKSAEKAGGNDNDYSLEGQASEPMDDAIKNELADSAESIEGVEKKEQMPDNADDTKPASDSSLEANISGEKTFKAPPAAS